MGNENISINTLSDEETTILFRQMKEGSTSARIKLMTSNINLVNYIVNKKFFSVNCDKDDLISVGKIGLIKAIDTFDLSTKWKFSTYACRCIKNEIYIYMRQMKKWQGILELEGIVIGNDKDNNELKIIDVLPDKLNIEQEYEDYETIGILKELLNQIPDGRNKKIVMLYFGFYDDKTYTQREIAKMMNVSASNIRRIIKNTTNYLKNELEEEDKKTNTKVKLKKKNNCSKRS